jgi:hypothetical protein
MTALDYMNLRLCDPPSIAPNIENTLLITDQWTAVTDVALGLHHTQQNRPRPWLEIPRKLCRSVPNQSPALED